MLQKLVESEGWKVLTKKWAELLRSCEIQLRAADSPQRDWIAGLVTGYERILNWPTKRSQDILRELNRQESAKPSQSA